jgi:cysteine desulfurase
MATYLDHNATTPLDGRVLDAMLPFLQLHHGNPSAVYREGRVARQAIETAREQVAQLVNAHPSQVIFTSGGTEANNLALKGAVSSPGCLAVSAIEHASVLQPARQAGRLIEIAVDGDGLVSEDAMREALAASPQLVSVMLANNETGVIQDVARLAAMAAEQKVPFHTDAVQAAGKIEVDIAALGVQLLTLSAHKIYGPKGIGALVFDKRIDLLPQMLGGGQEDGYRSGTENVAAIVGFGKAAELAAAELEQRRANSEALKQRLLQGLEQIDDVVVFASGVPGLSNTVYLALPGIAGETLLMEMDRADVAVASGSACDSRKAGPSHVLLAMGIEATLAESAVRVSIGKDNTDQDIDNFLHALDRQAKSLQADDMLAWA